MAVKRILVEKRPDYAVEAGALQQDLVQNLGMERLTGVRIINRYDIEGIDDDVYQTARQTIFSEAPVDLVYDEAVNVNPADRAFAVEYLPGQYDQRADSAMQCIQLLTLTPPPVIRTSKAIILSGPLSEEEFSRIKSYCINPVEAREASWDKPSRLEAEQVVPDDVAVLSGFTAMQPDALGRWLAEFGLAMGHDDLAFCQRYFRDEEQRDPTITEIRVIDTYWSDHCRHTTFLTHLTDVDIEPGPYAAAVQRAWHMYQDARREVYGGQERPSTLMDLATIGMKLLKRRGCLDDLDQSEEINAASIVVPVEIDGQTEDWLIMFKNETHNHPTEIEPFGGAATCLGGAIRDPLSGRSYVYQAMRVSGSGDPRVKVADTLTGKLPQRKITVGAAQGYSSYGNQIGVATGQVAEVYHPGFVAKRMEIGAVIAAAPRANVIRRRPQAGDVVLLVGGRTGRDGCGGATGSSKEHTLASLDTCSAEVQKGNAPTERKIQRLFRQPEAARLIKKCNDFGAGGVSVAIGELADGLIIYLDDIPKKYEGLDGTELAISESQERMAVVVDPGDVAEFCRLANAENVEVTPVARVTDANRLVMEWRGKRIVNISRDFLNTNGVQQCAQAKITAASAADNYFTAPVTGCDDLRQTWLDNLRNLNVCSQRGLAEHFDSTIGAATVLLPYGGRYELTPAEGMAAKLPVIHGETKAGTLMSFGYDPYLASWSPFHGALYAIVEAVAKIAAMGGDWQRIRLTLQEYFEKLGSERSRWGKPLSALLGALYAQEELNLAAIGGKDSMSGTFMNLHVPPTLVAFALAPTTADRALSPEFKQAGNPVVWLKVPRDEEAIPSFDVLKANLSAVSILAGEGRILAARSVRAGGVAAAISQMCFGNHLGFDFLQSETWADLLRPEYGSIILELPSDSSYAELLQGTDWELLGYTTDKPCINVNGVRIGLAEAVTAWQQPLNDVFPDRLDRQVQPAEILHYSRRNNDRPAAGAQRPRVIIPVFPGTNCEYDSARAFEKAGATVETLVFRNLSADAVAQSLTALAGAIDRAQILMLPGGFSAGDEPDGSGKFIAAVFRSPRIREAVNRLLGQRDGLALGICNGFQALIKLGLVPYGEIRDLDDNSPTLTYNVIGRHVSAMARTKVVSVLSPWLAHASLGDIHTVPVSHGEGRFVAPTAVIEQLVRNGQIACQYVDAEGRAATAPAFCPNQAMYAVEAITSPDGRVLGKMAHSERVGSFVSRNVPGDKEQQLFAAGVRYFR